MSIKFDNVSLSEVIKDFYLLTGIRIVVFDTDLNMIASMPAQDTAFCAALRKRDDFKQLCDKCTNEALEECKKIGKLKIYRCHAGLIEAVSPVIVNDAPMGYVMLGQVIPLEDHSGEKDKIIRYISKHTDSAEEIFSSLLIKNEAFIEASVKIMECCASYLLMKKLIITNESRIVDGLVSYINDNLASSITTDDLCRKFFISRNMLYKIFDKNFNTTVAKYIKKQKINKAKSLISEGASITEAAYVTGYNDCSYFSKVFKEVVGMLPTEFKKLTDKA